MPTISAPVEHIVFLRDASWDAYERLLAGHEDPSGIHFIYDQSELEIMMISRRHERLNWILAALVPILSEEPGIRISEAARGPSKREKKLQKGIEPDSAFYIAKAAEVEATMTSKSLRKPPPSDLINEVDVTSDSLSHFPIYAAFGVRETWLP